CKKGKRKIEPAEPRRTFELYGLTVPSVRKIPAAPKASAERRIVPRLPGSCRPAATTNRPSFERSSSWSEEKAASLTRAATPWGASLGTIELKSALGRTEGLVRAAVWDSSFSGRGRADSLKNMLSRCWLLR